MTLEEEETQKIGVPHEVSSWTVEHFISAINIMFNDVKSHKQESQWHSFVEGLLENVFNKKNESEVEKHIPTIKSEIGSIFEIL